jgi:hypothetical protein
VTHREEVAMSHRLIADDQLDDEVEFARPAQHAQWARLQELGLNTDSDLERSLGRRAIESIQRDGDSG